MGGTASCAPPAGPERGGRARRIALAALRWGLLLALVLWALRHCDGLWREFRDRPLLPAPVAGMLLVSLAGVLVQGLLTRAVVGFCGRSLGLLTACRVNVTAGLLGLVLPMGAVGYRGYWLKRACGIEWAVYASYYGLTLLASLAASLLLLLAACAMAGSAAGTLACLGGLAAGAGLLLLAGRVDRGRIPGRLRPLLAPCTGPGLASRFLALAAWQGLGLLVYVLLYILGFAAFGMEAGLGAVALMVAARSVFLLASIVPGNLVLQESLDGFIAAHQGLPLWGGVLAAGLIRLAGTLVLAACGLAGLLSAGKGAEGKPEGGVS